MLTIRRTDRFQLWYLQLQNRIARLRIHVRITQARNGNFSDCHSVGNGVFEMRLRSGACYRVYFTRIGDELVILLAGDDNSTPANDIFFAKRLAKSVRRSYCP